MEPLTSQDIITEINRLFGSKNTNHGKLFCPSVEFYNQLSTDEELTTAGKELCRWLGYKPRHLAIRFSDAADTADNHVISIPSHYMDFPYQTGALLAIGIMRHLITSQLKRPSANAAFIETATLERGFGIIVLNGLRAKRSRFLILYHLLHQNWHVHEGIALNSYRPADYGADLVRYAINYRIPGESWLSYINGEALRLLPIKGASHPKRHALPIKEQLHRQNARLWWTHMLLLSTLIAVTAAIILYILAQRPKQPPRAATEAYSSSQVLQNAYSNCIAVAKKQQNTTDVNNDFYDQQRLNATLSRCASIRNQYNYQIDTYNQTLETR